jgi:transglutaminase-like putative cysteine protease
MTKLDASDWRRLRVEHETRYRYSAPVELAHHVAFLRPLEDAAQRVEAFELEIDPEPSRLTTGLDAYGNTRVFFTATAPHDSLRVHATSRVQVASRLREVDPAASPRWEQVRERLRYVAGAAFEPAAEFTLPSTHVPRLASLADYALPSFAAGRPLLEAALELMHRVHADFRYQPEATEVHTPVDEVLVRRAGVCQDFSHLMIGGLRALGLAARYVSGYLLTTRAGGAATIGADASHAWVALWCPDTSGVPSGWLELDPTNDCVADTGHVRLAYGRDYGDVSPLRGVIRGGGSHTLTVRVSTKLDQDAGV